MSKSTFSDTCVSPAIKIDETHLQCIVGEYWEALRKHPKFCDKLCDLGGWEEVEDHYKKANNNSNEQVANMVLYEEIAEAMNAYQHGNKKHCIKELAQCGAVILRMMDFVRDEMTKERKNTLVLDLAYYDFNPIYNGCKNEITFPVENRRIAELLVDEAALAKEFWSCNDDESNITCGQLVKKHIKKYDKVLFECDSRQVEFRNPTISQRQDYRGRTFFVITWEDEK